MKVINRIARITYTVSLVLFACLACISKSKNIIVIQEIQLNDSCKCNDNCWPDLKKNNYYLNDDQILLFLNSIGEECKNDAEFSEVSNEVLFNIVGANPESFLKVIETNSSKIDIKWILHELENPVNDGIDVRSIFEKINNITGYDSTKNLIIKSLNIALNKN
jgi:hypothetical protein